MVTCRFASISRFLVYLTVVLALPCVGNAVKPALPASSGIFRMTASQFEEPFVSTNSTSPREDAALRVAVDRYRARVVEDDFGAMTGYLSDFPNSGWRIAILTNLGLSYYHDGYFSKAIESWEQAWKEGRSVQGGQAKPLVDRAIGELVRMHARLGHADRLAQLLQEIGGRPVSGPATEAITGAKEGLWEMQHEPGVAYLCGPMALQNLLLAQGAKPEKVSFLENYRSSSKGVSLQQVSDLADQAQLRHQLVFRHSGQPIPVPSIVHWKVTHFAAITEQQGEKFHVQDPTFGRDLWISRRALESEASGYFLVPANLNASASWRPVTLEEASQVHGMGYTGQQQTGANTPADATAHDDCSSSGGMCSYDITLLTVGVRLKDTPVGYRPPVGPDAHVMVVYNQREDSQPATFGWFNVGPKWTLSTLSYIQDDPRAAGSNVMCYVAGGGSVAYLSYTSSTGAFAPETRDSSVLVRTAATPITYERRLQGGGKEIYSQSNGATSYPRRIFLSQVVDRFGNASTYNYDSQLRLTSVTDATSRQTTFSYELATQPLLVTKITDPFGRSAVLAYDSSNRLNQITDVIGLVSKFTYDASSLINALTTPYGTTSFVYGDNGTTRFVNATDPLKQTERVEFHHQAPGIAGSDPQKTVPTGLGLLNEYLYYRDSYYWDKHMYPIAAGNYNLAKITHFHHWLANSSQTARSIESIKLPLENRVWFTYPGQVYGSYYSGSYDRPTSISRVLDDGTSQETKLAYNALGNVNDAIDPAGRETQLGYAANGIDVTTVQQKTSSTGFATLAAMTYNAAHLPLTVTDASGQTTTNTYNGAGQIRTKTDALGHVTTWNYDGQGYLTSVVNANNQIQVSFTYDGFGRIAARTDSEGYTVSFQYDALDRLTRETYPDGTTRQYAWDRLDLGSVTDRQGRTTSYAHDAVRQLTQITDPLQRKTGFGYYENGARKSLTDPKGNTTTWTIDLESRVTGKLYANGKGTTNIYEASTARLKSITDALGQKKQYAYTIDDRLAGITYANAVNPTANVSWAYDPYFPRPVFMMDGSGATAYTYQPVGSLGALQLAQEDGPYNNDIIGYQYDQLGRMATRTVAGSPETFNFDTINRLAGQSNALGDFDLGYLGQTSQLTSQMLHGSAVGTTWSYDTNQNDRRLLELINSGATRSYRYKTTPESNITQIVETAGAGSAFPSQTWNYANDDADRLISASSSLGKAYGYGYDDANNIASQQSPNGSVSRSYNNLNQVAGDINDANGNLLDDGQRTYTWDAEDRLLTATLKTQMGKSTAFRYDGYGRRIAIITNGTEVRYLWCGQQLCQARSAADVVTRRYFAQGELITLGGTSLYYAQDHLGSVRDVVTTQNGARVASYDYEPYGGPMQSSGRVSTDFRFAGLFYEPNSNLYLSYTRVYKPDSGRWTSRDTLGEIGGWNLYSYANAQPVSQLDTNGKFAIIDNIVAGAVAVDIGYGLSKLTGQCYDIGDALVDFGLGFATEGLSALAKARQVERALEAAKSVEAAEDAASELRRPYIRKSVREAVEDAAPRTADGRPIDPNTLRPIDGTPDLGHKPGNEFWREKAQAEGEGLTQQQFNDRMNDPSKYQLEDPSSNRSRKYEQP